MSIRQSPALYRKLESNDFRIHARRKQPAPGAPPAVSHRHPVLFGPFLHDPDDVLHLGVPRASQQVEDFSKCLSEEKIGKNKRLQEKMKVKLLMFAYRLCRSAFAHGVPHCVVTNCPETALLSVLEGHGEMERLPPSPTLFLTNWTHAVNGFLLSGMT